MTLKAEDIIRPDWLENYRQRRHVIWGQLIDFNTNVFTLEKIEKFPLKLFIPLYDDRIFWQTVKRALVEATIMIIWRILIDSDSQVLTLRQFKNEILQNSSSEKAKRQLKQVLKKADFEKRVSILEDKIVTARHNYIAHFNRDLHLKPDPKRAAEFSISLPEVKKLLDAARDLFDVLCFDDRHLLWLWGYSGNAREHGRTDIDQLLDDVARNSRILNLPEEDPEHSQSYFKEFSVTQLRVLNEYRQRFGLARFELTDK